MRSRLTLSTWLAWLLIPLAPAGAATDPVAQEPIGQDPAALEHFARLPEHADVALSPGGRYAAAKVYSGGQYILAIYDLDNLGKAPPVLLNPDDMEVNWLRWKSEDRLLVSLWFASRRWGTATVETRLFALDPDGRNRKLLVKPKRDDIPVQIADQVVSFLPGDPDHIVMAFNPDDPRLPRLYKVNVRTARQKRLESGDSDIFWWSVDQAGEARVGQGIDDRQLRSRVLLRPPGSKDWRPFLEGPVDEVPDFDPILFDQDDPDLAYVLSGHAGDTTGIYRFRLSTGKFIDTVFHHPEVDVASWRLDPSGTRLESIGYVLDEGRVHWLNPEIGAIVEDIRLRVSARHVGLVSASLGHRRMILYAESPDLPPRYYLYEPATDKLRYFAFAYPGLKDRPMGAMRSTRYRARDGLEIPAYVTLPPGIHSATPPKPLPAVIFPHGGPVARDMAAFDPLVQYMASQGYAVLQMNFRGSWGYGSEFKQSGFRQWGKAMQDDITDGTRWMIEEGIADPERTCIVGWSYGGYAALMGAVREPALYRCAVSIAGVSDLQALLNQGRGFLFNRTMRRHIGEGWKDREDLARNSPVNRAAEIKAPVLLVHGTKDRQVLASHSAAMARALDREKKTHEYLVLEDADHAVLRMEERLKLFDTLGRFLARHLGGTSAMPTTAGNKPAP